MASDGNVHMPADMASIRDAAVASVSGEGRRPKNLGKLFEWLFWNAGETEFDHPFYSLRDLNLSDVDVRDALELEDSVPVSDHQRLAYARSVVERIWADGERLSFAHAFRIERADGKFTFLCGMSWVAGQGGHQTNCDGLFESESAYLQRLKRSGMSDASGPELSLARVLRHWSG